MSLSLELDENQKNRKSNLPLLLHGYEALRVEDGSEASDHSVGAPDEVPAHAEHGREVRRDELEIR